MKNIIPKLSLDLSFLKAWMKETKKIETKNK